MTAMTDPTSDLRVFGLPEEISHLGSRINDIDSHEMLPAQEWVRALGPGAESFADYYKMHGEPEHIDKNSCNLPDFVGDTAAIDQAITAWQGGRAPGSVDHARRIEVMQAMGIARQLMFPSNPAVYAMFLYRYADDLSIMPFATGDANERRTLAKLMLHLHNEELASTANISDMIRPVPVVFGDTPEELLSHTESYIRRGIRAVWLFPSGELPGGVSPASEKLDPFYRLLEESRTALIVHAAGEGNFLRNTDWDKAASLEGHIRHVEFSRNPWFTAKMHQEAENLVVLLTMGGVFDRFPDLRFGAIETTAYWLGPLARRLDMWHKMDAFSLSVPKEGVTVPYRLPEKPSFYINRNVRVGPFFFEDIGFDIETNPMIPNSYCFSTDYPHVEGGKNAVRAHYEKIKHLGTAYAEDYFVNNGAWLTPD